MPKESTTHIRQATPADVPTILEFIRQLAIYEKLLHEVVATEDDLRRHLFGEAPKAEVVLAADDSGKDVGFALFFYNFSTFLGRPGLHLEDLYVNPEARGAGHGKRLLEHLAKLTVERGCGRLEWVVLDWNQPAIDFYRRLGAIQLEEWQIFRLADEALAELAQAQ